MKKTDFIELCLEAFTVGALRKLIFSRPDGTEITKCSGRLCELRGRRVMAIEYSLPGNTVSHKNVPLEGLKAELSSLIENYRQANLLTTAGDAEWKLSKKGKEALLGADALRGRLQASKPDFETAIEALDRQKNYLLSGKESFLIKLGISDKNGRVHDKKQGKFRQINKFLEHIEQVYDYMPKDGELLIYDLCCGKSYLSFAVYYYLHEIKGRDVSLLGIDLKRDVISWCSSLAGELGYTGMHFVYDDVRNTPKGEHPDMVISLHACDIATDVVLDCAARLGARVILSTPCCHRYLSERINSPMLSFVTDYPHLRGKLCEALTDSLRVQKLRASGYKVTVAELTDPESTPKNTLIRAIRDERASESELRQELEKYRSYLSLLLGDGANSYLTEISK